MSRYWIETKTWHSMQRLQGLQVTEDQIYHKFMDALEFHLGILEKVRKRGKAAT